MIITVNGNAKREEFVGLIQNANELIRIKADDAPDVFTEMNPDAFEVELYNSFTEAAEGGKFEGSIELISGYKFPDIVVNNIFGVEVKTTKQNKWTSTGNSIFESTRIEGVENIYIFFAKLAEGNIGFKYRPYEDCLYDIGVTHSPRYMIDMNTEESIFYKMGISYEEFRQLANPAALYKSYVRQNLKDNEEPWWISNDEFEPDLLKPVVRLFGSLSVDERNKLRTESLALFPILFSRNPRKYSNLATWLAAKHGVVNPSLRDVFSAGGQETIEFNGRIFDSLPRIFSHLNDGLRIIPAIVESQPKEDLERYWEKPVTAEPRFMQWLDLVHDYCGESGRSFINHIRQSIPD